MILCRYVAVCFQVEASEVHIWLYFYSFTSHSLSHLKAFKFVCWLCYFSPSIWLMDDFTDFFFSICNCFLMIPMNFKQVWINFQGTLSPSGVYSMHINFGKFVCFVKLTHIMSCKNWCLSCPILHEFFSPI